ncbi:hypothetical protein LOCC1_G001180 [Lachnellula occidentalis]|uniref:Uncharacterized protein n=1 Tax=Lachnellula occidentalis TaxID=215460 RepID=A0A8H8S8J5_9HELO|nr:hypothetical protein LOCC1_G001180 [Lachnellula occidentalis]
MANTAIYLCAAVAIFLLITLLFLAPAVQNSFDEHSHVETPTIPRAKAVLTSSASIRIEATEDEVFDAITNFDDYSWSSAISDYKFDLPGPPQTGSKGTFKLYFDGFGSRTAQFEITLLDRQRKRIAQRTTTYPRWLLGGETVQEVVPVEGQNGACEYRTYHTVEGLAAYYLLMAATEELAETQQKSAGELKFFIERQKR